MNNKIIKSHLSVRDLSRSEVLDVIRREAIISRSELSDSVSVSRATVSGIVADLLAIGLLEEVGVGESTGGRRPIKLCYRPESRKVVGVVLFNEQVQAALTDLEGSLLNYLEIPLHGKSPEDMLTTMKEAAEKILEGIPHQEVLGIGVGAPGIVNFENGVIEISVSKGWLKGGIQVRSYMEEALGFPVYVANRSRVAALGEHRSGIGRNVSNLIYVFLGQGIVAGIVIDGNLYLGSGSGAGEIGHVSLDRNGPLCECGNRGCLEVFASEDGILALARSQARKDADGMLPRQLNGRLDKLTFDQVIEAAQQGDPSALAVLDDAGTKIGFSVATLINLFDPEMVVIGGPVGAKAGDLLLKPVIREAQMRALPRSFQGVQIVTGTLGTKAIAIGAAVLAIKHTPIDYIFDPPFTHMVQALSETHARNRIGE